MIDAGRELGFSEQINSLLCSSMNNTSVMLSFVLYEGSTCSHRSPPIKTEGEMKPLSAFHEVPCAYTWAASQGRVLTKPLGTIQEQNKVVTLHRISIRKGGPGSQHNRAQKTLLASVFYLLVPGLP